LFLSVSADGAREEDVARKHLTPIPAGGERAEADFTAADDLIVVAHMVKVRGLRGEVVADLLTDFPDRFEGLASIIAVAKDGTRRSLQIQEHWFHGERLVLKFAGFDRIEEAKELVGSFLAVPSDQRVELPADCFYDWELIGCRVETIAGEFVGQVREIMRPGGVELLSVVDESERDRLIPMASEIVVQIDKGRKLIRIDPPEGLLEL
jgi:16S rRNA processing protein RimM